MDSDEEGQGLSPVSPPASSQRPLLLNPAYARCKSVVHEELRNFRVFLQWCAASYAAFLALALLVPARRRLALPPRRRLPVPGLRIGHHIQPRGPAPRHGARRHLVPHAGRLLPPLRQPPAAAVPRRHPPRRHRLRPPQLRVGAGPRVPPPGRAPAPFPLRRGRAQGRLLLLHGEGRAARAAPSPSAGAVARGGAGGHGGVVGVPHGSVPAGVRAAPPHLRAPDPALRGDLPHVRRRGARRRGRDLRRAPPHPHAAPGHQPPVQGVHHLLPRHHDRQPARRPPRRPLLQGRQELRKLRRPPGTVQRQDLETRESTYRTGACLFLQVGSAVQLSGFFMCLFVAARITHKAQRIVSIASQWHTSMVSMHHGKSLPASTSASDNDHVSGSSTAAPASLQAEPGAACSYQSRQALVTYLCYKQRRGHPVRLHARQGTPPHDLRLRDDSGAMDPKLWSSPKIFVFEMTSAARLVPR